MKRFLAQQPVTDKPPSREFHEWLEEAVRVMTEQAAEIADLKARVDALESP